jgi:alkaline phosphatase
MKTRKQSIAITLSLLVMAAVPVGLAQNAQPNATRRPPRRDESREQWLSDGRQAVTKAMRLRAQGLRARNVILFVGDGMGVSTVTAARILDGQMRGESGEENLLSFERLPYVAISKTYSVNQQTSDSAPTMTAIITGAKTNDGVLSVDQDVVPGDHTTVKGNELMTIFEIAEQVGLSTGVVSTARITHATPAACYAHSPERNWESDNELSAAARANGFPDIARQLIEFPYGDGPEVVLGGGRGKFTPRSVADPEYPTLMGERGDGRNLIDEWVAKRPRSVYAWNKGQFDATNLRQTDRLLGLFEISHMKYEHDRKKDVGSEPSLSEMTSKAIDLLAKNRKGFFLMVEGGRIDHAHHDNNAYRALTETIEFANAVKAALAKVDLRETLVIVTADHSHTLTIAGYPTRGNDILGKVRANDDRGNPASSYEKDAQGLPYTTLGYINGRMNTSESQSGNGDAGRRRLDLSNVNTADPNYRQGAAVPLATETHGGDDVVIYAGGPCAHLFHGVQEQNVIFHIMVQALKLPLKRGSPNIK